MSGEKCQQNKARRDAVLLETPNGLRKGGRHQLTERRNLEFELLQAMHSPQG